MKWKFSIKRSDEAGFTLAETLAALLVLSLAMSALASFVSHAIKVQDRTQSRIDSVRLLALAYADGQALTLPDGVTLKLTRIERDTPASCLYDVLQRRCR